MSRVLVVLAAAVVLLGALVWFAVSTPTPRSRATPAPAVAGDEPRAPAAVLAGAPAEAPPPDPAPAPLPATPAREAASPIPAGELARAQWIDGRVLFPPGTPDDEQLFVTARGRDFADGGDHRVEVARDGSFRVAFHAETRTGHFALEGRYLYLDGIERWRGKESSGTVVLEPLLGARIAGTVRLPPGADPGAAAGRVELRVLRQKGDQSSTEQVGACTLTEELRFAFEQLVPGASSERSYELAYDGERFVGESGTLVPEAGRTLAVELALEPAVVLAGLVRDASGVPLAGVRVHAYSFAPSRSWSRADARDAESAADGTFRLAALRAGKVQLRAQREGFEPLERKLGELEGGAELTDLVLELGGGAAISGLVRWPDGSQAKAELELVPERTSLRWSGDGGEAHGTSEADGSFSIRGLSAASYRVAAHATRTEEVPATREGARTKRERTEWSAELEHVAAGTSGLVLTLSRGLALAGRAVDDLGAPLEDFRIEGSRIEAGRTWFDSSVDVSRSFREAGGSFILEGFAAGDWELVARAKGHADSTPLRVTLPAGEPVVLVLPREARVGGRVVDPSGAPVADARVGAMEARSPMFPSFRDDEGRSADGRGVFELDGLGPGTVQLRATAPGFAPSAFQPVELVPGQSVAGVVLALRRGGTILGELLGSAGRPEAGSTVHIGAPGFSVQPETDADGRFLAQGVPPGEVRLWTQTREGIQLHQSLTLAEGETARVRLAPASAVVRLHGRVRAAGAPLAGANLYAFRMGEGGQEPSSSSSAESDAEGAYELSLPGAGSYRLGIHKRDEGALSWSVALEVPAVEAFAFDLAIPLGRISGRVTDSAGAPVRGLTVASEPEQHEGGPHGSAQALTDADGRYELLLPPGRHAVKAGGSGTWWEHDVQQPYSEARVSGLVLGENGHLRGVDLRLGTGGILEGFVREAEGAGAPFAQLWSERDGETLPLGFADENGRFELSGVAPGTHLVSATRGGGATREPARVEIVAGETRQLELALVPARSVHLTVRQRGVLVGSELELRDARGHRQPLRSGANGEAWLGPLVPGHYTVSARRDGKEAERTFEVAAGEGALELELALE